MNLIKDALQQDKITKRKAAEIIEGMALDYEDDRLATLYTYFMPKPTAKAKLKAAATDNLAWVALVPQKNNARHYLNWVYSDGTNTVATDGYRMHIWRNSNMEAGFYDATRTDAGVIKDTDYGDFPDYETVAKPKPDADTLRGYLSDVSVIPVAVFNKRAHCELTIHGITLGNIDQAYWGQAVAGMPDDASVTVTHDKDNLRCIYINSDDKTAVVMGSRK